MKNSLKMKSIHFIIILVGVFTSYSYGEYGEVDLESKLWELAKTDNFCRAVNFKGVNVNIFNEEGQSPLMIAAQHKNSRFIECMNQAKADVFMKDHDGKTAFDYIKQPKSKSEEIFSIRTYNALQRLEVHQIIGDKAQIIQEEINLKKGIYKLSIEGATCEEFALPKEIQCIALEKKKRNGPAYTIYEHDVNRGVPPIFAAIQNRMYNKLRQILHMGADIEMKNKFGDTPLQFAYKQNDDRLLKILLEYSANPNVGKGFYSLLSEACVINRISTVKLLLKYGANINYQYKKSESALKVAAKGCKNFELVRYLLDNGANLNLTDDFDFNIVETLYIHCRNDKQGHKKMLKLIYEYASEEYPNRLEN